MKKILFFLILGCSIGFAANAQEKSKVKKATPAEKFANPFRKNSGYKGNKIRTKSNSATTIRKVTPKKAQ